ncbi:MAG TPA: right-handed parallel beta-helix repeat-containing protein [Candidatus Saccharimonadales bacterium]
MVRLPQPGSDDYKWGDILNEYLRVEHAADGSLKLRQQIMDAETTHNKGQPGGYAGLDSGGSLLSAQLPTVPTAKLETIAQNALALADNSIQKGSDFLSVKDAPFNAKGDGTTDDTAAIKNAFDTANSLRKPLFFPPGQYVCSWFYKAYPPRVWAQPGTVTILASNANDATWNFGTTSYGAAVLLTANFTSGSQVLQLTSTAGLAPDDLIVVRDNTTDNGTAQAQTLRIASIDSATQLTTSEPAYTTFTLAANARMQPLPKNQQSCYVRGFIFKSIAPNTATASFLRLWYCRDIDIDIEGEGASNPGIILEGCYQFRVKATARNYLDQTVTGLPQFGYGVNVSGASAHGEVNVIAEQVRHAVSFNGTGYDVRVTGIAHGTTSTAWDAHTGSTNIVFDNCQAVGCNGFGFALRGKRQHVQGGIVDGCYGGVFVFDSPGDNKISNLRITNLRAVGASGNNGNGILVSNPSSGLTIQNNEIANCPRNGISFRATGINSNLVISGNVIRNFGQALIANDRCGIQQLSSTSFNNARFSNNIFEDTQSTKTAQFGIQLAAAGTDVSIYNNEFYNGITPFNGIGVMGVAKIGSNVKNNALVGNRLDLTFAATQAFDTSLANILRLTLTGNVTSSTFSNATDGQVIHLIIAQDSVGGRTFSWPTNITWQGPVPTVDATAEHVSAFSFVYIASTGNWISLSTATTGSGNITDVGTLANRPPAADVIPGNRYFATDVGTESISDGVNWFVTAGATVTTTGLLATRPMPSSGNAGTRFFATDYGREYYSDGAAWYLIGMDESVLFGGHTLTTGESVMQRTGASGTVTLSNTLLRFTYFTARITETITQIRFFVATPSSGTPPTVCRIGIYQVDNTGNLAQLVALANDSTLFSTTGAITKSLPSSFNKVRGQRYAIGFLCVTAGTQPTVSGVNLNSAVEASFPPRISGSVNASDLSVSYTAAAIGNAGSLIQIHLLP